MAPAVSESVLEMEVAFENENPREVRGQTVIVALLDCPVGSCDRHPSIKSAA